MLGLGGQGNRTLKNHDIRVAPRFNYFMAYRAQEGRGKVYSFSGSRLCKSSPAPCMACSTNSNEEACSIHLTPRARTTAYKSWAPCAFARCCYPDHYPLLCTKPHFNTNALRQTEISIRWPLSSAKADEIRKIWGTAFAPVHRFPMI